jgi:hypothetical protein
MSELDKQDNFVLVLLLGALLGFCTACLLILCPVVGLQVLEKYQTLVAGCIAAVGLYVAVQNTNRQIANTSRLEDDRRSRDFFAARSLSSHALSQLCEYAQDCCQRLKALVSDTPTSALELIVVPAGFKCSAVPKDAVERLERLLKFGDNAEIQNRSHELIGFLQIQNSRMNSLKRKDYIFLEGYCSLLADAVELYTRCEMLIVYTRHHDAEVPGLPRLNNFQNAMHQCGVDLPPWEVVYKVLVERWPATSSIT